MENKMMNTKWTKFFFGLACYSQTLYGQTIFETKQNLKQLEHKIAVVKKNMNQTQAQKKQFQNELIAIEQQIQINEKKLAELKQNIALKENEIPKIKQKISQSQREFSQIQGMLMRQLQTRYKQSSHQPFEWFLQHPQQKAEFNLLLTYYRYIIHMDQDLLKKLKDTQETLDNQHKELQLAIETYQHMQILAKQELEALQTNKKRHLAFLNTLQNNLNSQEMVLSEYQRNTNNLNKILTKLSSESVLQTRHPMNHMKRKLPNPVDVEMNQIQSLHQGIMLYTPTGAPVHAIYPGKVVFSEWLNGYGRLLIIDHGWGLMTLYANNDSLTKQTGDIVNQGEQIATVGNEGISKQSGLYFEVRKHGKAISPLDWLRKTKG